MTPELVTMVSDLDHLIGQLQEQARLGLELRKSLLAFEEAFAPEVKPKGQQPLPADLTVADRIRIALRATPGLRFKALLRVLLDSGWAPKAKRPGANLQTTLSAMVKAKEVRRVGKKGQYRYRLA